MPSHLLIEELYNSFIHNNPLLLNIHTPRNPSIMTEPPAKRAKRTDSAAMWESNASRRSDSPHHQRPTNGTNDRREERDRHHGRGDGRYRSRSREKRRERSRSREGVDKRRQRSYSRERDSRRHREGERNGVRDRRDRDRSRSRHRHRPKRGKCTASTSTWTDLLTNTSRRASIQAHEKPISLTTQGPDLHSNTNPHTTPLL